MESTPRPNELYRQIAKDYNPKPAMMNICKYIQALEARIAVLESARAEESAGEPQTPTAKKGAKKNG